MFPNDFIKVAYCSNASFVSPDETASTVCFQFSSALILLLVMYNETKLILKRQIPMLDLKKKMFYVYISVCFHYDRYQAEYGYNPCERVSKRIGKKTRI